MADTDTSPTTPVHFRAEKKTLAALVQMGLKAKPKPLNRSEMINVAIAEYVANHERKKK